MILSHTATLLNFLPHASLTEVSLKIPSKHLLVQIQQ